MQQCDGRGTPFRRINDFMTDNTMAAPTATSIGASAPNAPSRSSCPSASQASANSTTFAVILSLSFCHLLNDMMQSMISALYPMFKADFHLDYSQIGRASCRERV